ncbi:hypothetical protein [Vibrio sp. RE86]|uniref:hypothetical protein n=1 Tax=Vibrio sp. RE86 TaxID=2607605 RepID=UPI0020A38D4A|nr:hypothetical protein [Vibrio sp. RE86]
MLMTVKNSLSNAKFTRLMVLALAMFTLGGCAKTTVVENEFSDQIEVLYEPPVGSNYKELGLITMTTGQTIFHDYSGPGIIKAMTKDAVKLGADAIIIRSVIEGHWGFKGEGTGIHSGSGEALAIKFIESHDE